MLTFPMVSGNVTSSIFSEDTIREPFVSMYERVDGALAIRLRIALASRDADGLVHAILGRTDSDGLADWDTVEAAIISRQAMTATLQAPFSDFEALGGDCSGFFTRRSSAFV